MEDFVEKDGKKLLRDPQKHLLRLEHLIILQQLFLKVLQISSTGIVVVGVFLVSNQSITTGALIACVILSGRVLSPLVQIGLY